VNQAAEPTTTMQKIIEQREAKGLNAVREAPTGGARAGSRGARAGYVRAVARETRQGIGPIVDCNVHLWDQRENPVFWLSDRTLVRDMLGDYDSLPDGYSLADYRRETGGHDVRGVIWSDAGAADPLAAADWVSRQQDGAPPVIAMVTLGDPASAAFAGLVENCRQRPLIRSIRMRLVAGLSGPAAVGGDLLDDPLVRDNLALIASSGLVATVEATSSQLEIVTRLAAEFPALNIVIDHFGWPSPGPGGDDLTSLAAAGNVATRIDAIGTLFGDWTLPQIRPWLLEVTGLFSPQRCMLGSDLPIENLRSGFGPLYAAYADIFSGFSGEERAMLFHGTAERWYARRGAAGPAGL
jgi:predicted TIM-barrel fold metal-dependent hydrolase